MRGKWCLYVFLVYAFVASLSCYAQRLIVKNYSVKEGLPSATVYRTIQDNKGFIWMCTESGICRFDGYAFKTFTENEGLQDNLVIKIFCDSYNRIWYLTIKKTIGYIENDIVHPLPELNKQLKQSVCEISQSYNGDLLFATHGINGIFVYSPSLQFKKYIKCAFFFLEGGFLFHNNNNSIAFIEGVGINKEVKRVVRRISGTSYETMNSASIDESGSKYGLQPCCSRSFSTNYVFGNRVECFVYDSLLQMKQKISPKLAGAADVIYCVYQDKKSNIWIGTSCGLLKYSMAGNVFNYEAAWLRDEKITDVFEDDEANLWVATRDHGVYLLTSSFIEVLQENGINTMLKHLQPVVNGVVYASEKPVLYLLDKHHKLRETDLKSSLQNRITDLQTVNGKEIWIGTDLGVIKVNAESPLQGKQFYFKDSLAAIKSIYPLSGSKLLIGRHSPIDIYDLEKGRLELILGQRAFAVLVDKQNNYWMSTDKGFYKRDASGKLVELSKHFVQLNRRIKKIKQHADGSIWMASQGNGVFVLRNDSLLVINTASGLPDNFCNDICFAGNVAWIATADGIGRIQYNSAGFSTTVITPVTNKHGLPAKDVEALALSGDTLYVATHEGLCFFDLSKVSSNKKSPPVFISNVNIAGADTVVRASYDLPYTQNNIRVSFVGLTYRSPGDVIYSYKMSGIDSAWKQTTLNYQDYVALAPGSYTFMVKAMNEDGVESGQAAVIHFVITPPYWKTAWFLLSAVGFTAFLVLAISLIRFRQVKEKNKLRTEILVSEQKALRTQMNPHFIFNALNSIQRFVLENDPLKANEYLSSFGNLIRRVFDNSARPYVSLHNEIETLRLYLELEALRFDKTFNYNIDIPADIDRYTIQIPPMIIQPYVENAIWHGLMHKKKGDRFVQIKLQKSGEQIICEIADNGIGREQAMAIKKNFPVNKHKSSGMKTTEERLKNLKKITKSNFEVSVADLYDENNTATGTRVTIIFSLQH